MCNAEIPHAQLLGPQVAWFKSQKISLGSLYSLNSLKMTLNIFFGLAYHDSLELTEIFLCVFLPTLATLAQFVTIELYCASFHQVNTDLTRMWKVNDSTATERSQNSAWTFIESLPSLTLRFDTRSRPFL